MLLDLTSFLTLHVIDEEVKIWLQSFLRILDDKRSFAKSTFSMHVWVPWQMCKELCVRSRKRKG
jgi:hypothetical protein